MYLVSAIILFIAGLAINIAINRRRFYRRGLGGLQQFETYGKAVAATFMERLGKFLAFILMLLGLASLFIYFFK